MYRYVSTTDSDFILEAWFHRLIQSDELKLIFTNPATWKTSTFMAYFQPPRVLWYRVSEADELIHAIWFDPMPMGAMTGIWIHPEHRKSKDSLAFVEHGLVWGIHAYHYLFGLVTQAHLLEPYQRLGYTVLTPLPHGCDGQDAWLIMLDAAGLKGRQHGQRTVQSSL